MVIGLEQLLQKEGAMSKFRVSNLTKRQLTEAMEKANLTRTQRKIVEESNREELNDIGIMAKLHLSNRRYYAEKRIALKKISDVSTE